MIAKTILGVQPLSPTAGELFHMNNKWSEWRRTISFWPRKSISGKIIIGQINKRSKNSFKGTRALGGRKIRIHEFATNKELFTVKLKGET